MMRGPLIFGALVISVLPVASQSILDVVRYTVYLALGFPRPPSPTTRFLVANNLGQEPSLH